MKKYPDWVPTDVVDFYAAWIDQTGPFAQPDDATYQNREPKQKDVNVKSSYSVAFECLEYLMLSPTMKGAWTTIGKRAKTCRPALFAERTIPLICRVLNPHPLGTVDQANALRKSADKLSHALKLISVNINLDEEFKAEGSIEQADGSREIIFQSDLTSWFKTPPDDAINNLANWLKHYASMMESVASERTKQPKSQRAPVQRLITQLSDLMYELYGGRLDDAVASIAESVLAFFGSDEIITRDRVMQLRKSRTPTESGP